MAVGQVGFKDQRKVGIEIVDHPAVLTICQVKRIHVEKRENPIVNRLNKTKVEKFPDLAEEKESRLKELRSRAREAQQQRVSRVFISYL